MEFLRPTSGSVAAIRAAARTLDESYGALQKNISESSLRNRRQQILREILAAGAAREFLDYVSAEQAFMAVQMLAYELNDRDLQDQLDALANALEDDERYRPAQFAGLLRTNMADE